MDNIAEARYFCSTLADGADPILQILIDHFGVVELKEFLLTDSKTYHPFKHQWLEDKGYSQAKKHFDQALQRWQPRIELFKKKNVLLEELEEKYNCSFIYPEHKWWIKSLEDLHFEAPIGLWHKGEEQSKAVALVGSRAATDYGKACAFNLASGLALEGCSVISGGAYGIDTAAHLGALNYEAKTTVVFANGFGNLYPKGNYKLFQRILDNGGSWISETHPEVMASKWRFLQRNRLIACLSKMIIVVEAAHRSGAKNTVNHAYNINRPVGVVPGNITSNMSAGCLEMLKENPDCYCITGIDDILAVINELPQKIDTVPSTEKFWNNSDELRVLDAMPRDGAFTVTQIAANSGLSKKSVSFALKKLSQSSDVINFAELWSKKV
ncbi:MAG: DNA-processing protein DprA [Micrococcaceae bacterium]